MNWVKKHIISFVVMVFMILTSNELSAQVSPYYSVRYRDSIEKEPNSEFVYNTVTITNTFGRTMVLFVTLNSPAGWRLLADNQTTIELHAGETYELPVAFSKTPEALATWTPANVQVQIKNDPTVSNYTFYIKAKARANFLTKANLNDIVLAAYQDSIPLKVYIKNTGNIEENYKLYLKNSFFELNNKEIKIKLAPGKDTSYAYALKLTKNAWKYLKKEEIKLSLNNDSGRFRSYVYTIRKISSISKVNQSEYKTIPVSVEGGVGAFGKQMSYYGGVSGAFNINANSSIAFMYRSQQFGVTGIQHAIWGVTYNYKNMQLYVGQITDQRLFSTNGNGAKLSFKWGIDNFFSIYGIQHYSGYSQTTDVVEASLQYHLKSIKIRQDVAASNDDRYHVQSYVFNNDLRLVKTKNMSFSVIAGGGFDHYNRKTYDSTNNVLGGSMGYSFLYATKHISFVSITQYNDNNFPGNMKGYKMNSHAADWNLDHAKLGIFYQSLYAPSNYFKDSLYNPNTFIQNISNYGIHAGLSGKGMALNVSAGIMSQLGLPNTPPNYQSLGADYSLTIKTLGTISLNSLEGYTNMLGNSSGKNISIYMERASITNKYGGVFVYYSKLPNNELLNTNPTPATRETAGYIETLNFSPFVDLHLFHNALAARLQYNESKVGNNVSSNFTSGLTYDNKQKGFTFQLNTTVQTTGKNTVSSYMSFRKNLNVPLVFKKEFYTLNIHLFIDENGNGKVDSNDAVIKNVEVKIDDYSMLTDESGTVSYENIKKGNYKLDFGNVRGLKGLVPTMGIKQVVGVTGNTDLYIPFKKSRYAYGNIFVDLVGKQPSGSDLENFKISAKDTSGNEYTAFTNESGEYYLNLPTGRYQISLNPQAFDDVYKPVQMSYDVDLINNEEANVNFKVVQKKRAINMITPDLK